MIKKKIKPLLPTLRERKRYLAFEIISESPIGDFEAVSSSIWTSCLSFLGELECGKAGIMMMKYNNQRGLIKVSHKYTKKVRASISLMQQIKGTDVIVRSIGLSGTIKKAEGKYLAA